MVHTRGTQKCLGQESNLRGSSHLCHGFDNASPLPCRATGDFPLLIVFKGPGGGGGVTRTWALTSKAVPHHHFQSPHSHLPSCAVAFAPAGLSAENTLPPARRLPTSSKLSSVNLGIYSPSPTSHSSHSAFRDQVHRSPCHSSISLFQNGVCWRSRHGSAVHEPN